MQTSQASDVVKPNPNPKRDQKAAAVAARARAVEEDPRWASVRARDTSADGRFYYSVETTGVYCRPSCAARPARPENVRFHETREQAERAGYRACKRCRPHDAGDADRGAERVATMCRLIETSETAPTLDVLARHVGLSSFHAHRMFKAVTGLTPRGYAVARRRERVQAELAAPTTVTQAIYDAGYSSSGRFYGESRALLGMTPTELKAGGSTLSVRFAVGVCTLGSVLVAATDRGVCAVLLGEDPEELTHDLERRFPNADLVGGDASFELLVARVIGHLDGGTDEAEPRLPLDIRGTAFQQRVWTALGRIPLGTTISYTELAAAIGSPKSVRAVASACAANAHAVLIPCHRVVRTDGSLSGYRWGLERKRALLDRERSPRG